MMSLRETETGRVPARTHWRAHWERRYWKRSPAISKIVMELRVGWSTKEFAAIVWYWIDVLTSLNDRYYRESRPNIDIVDKTFGECHARVSGPSSLQCYRRLFFFGAEPDKTLIQKLATSFAFFVIMVAA